MRLSLALLVFCLATGTLANPIFKQNVGKECPDKKNGCIDTATCCLIANNVYGCCQHANAVCCTDKKHCCPSGYNCDTKSGTCTKKNMIYPLQEIGYAKQGFLKLVAASPHNPDFITCGDKTVCTTGTCCKLADSNGYGCCSFVDAVCCSDHLHCCPREYVCKEGKCSENLLGIVFESPIVKATPQNVVCADGQSECPDGNTCCKLSSGQYGCCPLPNAVCCADGVHCCPNGYTCDTGAGTCMKGLESIPIFKKKPAINKLAISNPLKVTCPDDASSCPIGNVCCEKASGGYGCCPQDNGVCCSDKLNCCPEGYTCDVEDKSCKKADAITFVLTKAISSPQNVQCPGGQSECPDGNTCCKLSSGQWGCCPIPMAVCCADGMHCCPNGYTCDTGAGTCTKGLESIPFIKKTAAIKSPENVVCADGQSECPDGNTCCKLSSGQYGCCPLTNAVCCADGVHCCPNGYTCDTGAGTCMKGLESIPFFKKIAAMNPFKIDSDFL